MGGINGGGMGERLVGGGGCGGTLTPRSAVQTPQPAKQCDRPAGCANGLHEQCDGASAGRKDCRLGMLVGGSWDCGETVSAVPPAIEVSCAAVSSVHDAREDHSRSGVCTYQGKKFDSMHGGSFFFVPFVCWLSSVVCRLSSGYVNCVALIPSSQVPDPDRLFHPSQLITFLSYPSLLGGSVPSHQRLQRRGQLGPWDPWYNHRSEPGCLTGAVVQPAARDEKMD